LALEGIPFIEEGNTPLSKEESVASLNENNYIPSGLLDNIVHYSLCPLADNKWSNSFVIVITYISI
jgi:hypothetical protein